MRQANGSTREGRRARVKRERLITHHVDIVLAVITEADDEIAPPEHRRVETALAADVTTRLRRRPALSEGVVDGERCKRHERVAPAEHVQLVVDRLRGEAAGVKGLGG